MSIAIVWSQWREREHSFAIRHVEDRRLERVCSCGGARCGDEEFSPTCKKSRKTKVSVCPSGGFSSLSSTSDVAVAPPESEGVEVLPSVPASFSGGGEYSTIDDLLKSLGN